MQLRWMNILLEELLFQKSKVICTSATLATVGPNPVDPEDRGPNFAYFRRRVGLDNTEYPDVLEHILPHTFDYEKNALLYLPRHLPEPVYGPDSYNYTNKIAEEMMHLVEASLGRAFLLFSSKRMLDAVYNIFLDHLPTYLDFRLLRQGDMNRIELVREFRESEGAVLISKQGLGRLLRTHEDRGVMAILDTRLHTKSFGTLVINALPPARRTENLKDVQRFFEEDDNIPF